MLARLRMGLQWHVPRRNIPGAKQVCGLRQDVPEEFGTKRSQVQILSARFSSIHLTERHFRFSPVVGWCGLQDGKPGESTGFQIAPGTQASFSPPTQAVLASGRHPLWQGSLPRCAAPPGRKSAPSEVQRTNERPIAEWLASNRHPVAVTPSIAMPSSAVATARAQVAANQFRLPNSSSDPGTTRRCTIASRRGYHPRN